MSDVDSLVTIFGGSGFLGRRVVHALAKEGYRIRVAVRHPDLAGHLQKLGHAGQIRTVRTNVHHPASIEAAAGGSSTIINLVGILFERGPQTFDSVHVRGAAAVARAAAQVGASMIHISAIGADRNSQARYARSKALGEQAVLSTTPAAAIFRPSILFGPEDDFFNRFAAMARLLPALPLIGGGLTRFQPVFVDDVAQAVVKAVKGETKPGMIYELGGPQIKTFKELMEFVLSTIERRRFLVPIPFAVAKLQAMFLQCLPKPPLTPDQVELLKTDNVVSEEAAREGRTLQGLGIEPTSMAAIVPSYL